MKFRLSFPSSLQYGDNLEIKGEAGFDSFSLDLLSDYLAFDPVAFDESNGLEGELPVVETQPLQIVFESTGGWDVNAKSPETSTTSHGTSARRCGFRTGEKFVCNIAIRKEYFEVSLNNMPIASSEHLIPVASIHGLEIGGDSVITSIKYGHPVAIGQYRNRIYKNNQIPTIVECRLSDMLLDDENYFEFEDSIKMRKNPLSNSEAVLCPPTQKVPGGNIPNGILRSELVRTNSYQLVFKSDSSDPEDTLNLATNGESQLDGGSTSASQKNLLLLDDPEFSLDEENQSMLNFIALKKQQVKRRRKSSHRAESSLAKRAYARRDKNILNKHRSMNMHELNCVPLEKPTEQVRGFEVERQNNGLLDLLTNHLQSTDYSIPNQKSLQQSPVKTEQKASTSPYEINTVLRAPFERRHSLSTPDVQADINAIVGSVVHAEVDHKFGTLRRSQSFATSTSNPQGFRHSLASLNEIPPSLKPHLSSNKAITTTDRSSVQSPKLFTAPPACKPCDSKENHPDEQVTCQVVSVIKDPLDAATIRNISPSRFSSIHDEKHLSSGEKPPWLGATLSFSNHKSNSDVDEKFHHTKTSQPMLLIDFHPLEFDKFVIEESSTETGFSVKESHWTGRPKSQLILVGSNKPSSHGPQETEKSTADGATVNNFEPKVNGKTFELRNSEILTKVPDSVSPIANSSQKSDGKGSQNGKANPPDLRSDVNDNTKRRIFRSKLPRPKSELVPSELAKRRWGVRNLSTLTTSPALAEEHNQNSDAKGRIQPEQNCGKRASLILSQKISKSHGIPNDLKPTQQISLNTRHSFSVRNIKPSTSQQLQSYPAEEYSSKSSTAHQNGKPPMSKTDNSNKPQPKLSNGQISLSKDPLDGSSNNLKKFVQSPRRWLSEKFSSNKKHRAVVK
ncbi:hypothetical protein T265_04918 [Opisthorchis viverrini]|uniref:Galectin domain-containing protein n=1 Tax=Opisthorchis viverrini TaxID=6198 RepID=A0A074ZME9_OPIVI|nr:hypothetical protein T265_04918 [Opisthorchis viverrini]KER28246.1 hypothetical protein T265_04918 [Opisthorchis viverrini]